MTKSQVTYAKYDPGYGKKKKIEKIFTAINGVYLVVFISLGGRLNWRKLLFYGVMYFLNILKCQCLTFVN